MQLLGAIALPLLAALLLLNLVMYRLQPGMIFLPDRQLVATPDSWGLDYESVAFAAADGTRLHGWYLPHPDSARVLLFFHGNAGNLSHRRDSLEIFHRLGLNILIIDYRGYGLSEGTPSERGLYQDAAAAWDFLTAVKHVDHGRILIFGRSLGGAVAAQLASRVKPAGLILESTLSSARDFAGLAFPLLSRLTLLRYDFPVADSLRRVSCPVLVLHSPDDEIMPYVLGEKVFQAARQPKTFYRLQGDHNSGFLRSQPGYEQALSAFIDSVR